MLKLNVLQAVRLKGRATSAAVVGATGEPSTVVEAELARLAADDLVTAGVAVRITPKGKDRLAELLNVERANLPLDALAAAYEAFDAHNTALKQVVTAWQLKDAQTPNDHLDEAYDAGVVQRLAEVHQAVAPLLQSVADLVPRLAPYPGRFQLAIDAVLAGDRTFIARPMIDSYHTVWFELHEELIGLLGRTRAEEAAAGRAL